MRVCGWRLGRSQLAVGVGDHISCLIVLRFVFEECRVFLVISGCIYFSFVLILVRVGRSVAGSVGKLYL